MPVEAAECVVEIFRRGKKVPSVILLFWGDPPFVCSYGSMELYMGVWLLVGVVIKETYLSLVVYWCRVYFLSRELFHQMNE